MLEASSSRSQVHRSSRRAYLAAGLPRVSVDVRGSPWTNVAIVTQLVTQPSPVGLVAESIPLAEVNRFPMCWGVCREHNAIWTHWPSS